MSNTMFASLLMLPGAGSRKLTTNARLSQCCIQSNNHITPGSKTGYICYFFMRWCLMNDTEVCQYIAAVDGKNKVAYAHSTLVCVQKGIVNKDRKQRNPPTWCLGEQLWVRGLKQTFCFHPLKRFID